MAGRLRRFAQTNSKDRLKKWEATKSKNELAQFCPLWLPIDHNAVHWDPRALRPVGSGVSSDSYSNPTDPACPVKFARSDYFTGVNPV
jgi:hypothetical protein